MKSSKIQKVFIYGILIVGLCLLSQATNTTIQYSTDNVTWVNSNIISTTNDTSTVVGLKCNTLYNFRIINDTNGVVNVQQRTKPCGLSEMEIAIMMFLGILIIMGGFATYYFDTGLKLAFLLGTALLSLVGLNLAANFAHDAGVSANVVNVLWTCYTVGVILFFALVLYALYVLTTNLRIRKNPPPNMGSPIKDNMR